MINYPDIREHPYITRLFPYRPTIKFKRRVLCQNRERQNRER